MAFVRDLNQRVVGSTPSQGIIPLGWSAILPRQV